MIRIAGLVLACVLIALGPKLAGSLASPRGSGSIAADAAVSSSGTLGMPLPILQGRFPRDGTLARQRKIVFFGDHGASMVLDLGREMPIAAILVQALHDDRYSVEASIKEGTWSRVWSVLPTEFESGLHSRHHLFPTAERARWLRIRNEAGKPKISAIRAIRVFSEAPARWPDSVQTSSGKPKSAFPWLDLYSVTIAKFIVALAAGLLMLASFLFERSNASASRQRLVKQVLVSVSLVAGLCWWNLFQYTSHVYAQTYDNYWDVYHYYLGSKYAPELGYTKLYRCSLIADLEDGLASIDDPGRYVRDLQTNSLVPANVLRADPHACKRDFSNARWASFKRDHAFIRTLLPPDMWQKLTLDHGYNPSPAWAILGRTLSSTGPASAFQMAALISLDTILLVVMWNMIWSSFGWRVACAGLVFWGTNYVAGNWFTAGAFLRHDWLFLAVAGVCCLKRDRTALAGFLLAWSTLLRLFPGFFILGVGLKIVVDAVEHRSFTISKAHRKFVLGAGVGALVIVLLSILAQGRATAWQEFAINTVKHRATLIDQNIGIDQLFGRFDRGRRPGAALGPTGDVHESRSAHPVRDALFALAFFPLLLAAVRKEEAWSAAILSMGWLPFAIGLSNYYWAMLLMFAFLAVRKPVVMLGVAAMAIVWSAMGLIFPLEIDHPWPPFGGEAYSSPDMYVWSSLSLMVFIVWITALFALPRSGRAGGRA